MNIKRNHTPGEIGPKVVLSWIIIATTAYCFLPWIALEYGITDFTMDELLDALGWNYNKATLAIPLSLLILVPFAWVKLSPKKTGWLFTLVSGVLIGILLASFIATNTSMGLAAGLTLICMAALFAIGISELGFQRGDTFIAGAVIFVIFMVVMFIFFPVWEIFRNVLFNKTGAFEPFQFFRIITSFGVGRVIWNTLKLAFTVGAATTVCGLIFALYSVRATTRFRYMIRVFYNSAHYNAAFCGGYVPDFALWTGWYDQ